MAATYVPALRGYIADVPWFYFRRGDGTVFTNKHVTQCSLSPQSDFQEVRAGWSQYATAYIPGQATMDVNITFGDFDQDLFSIFNGTDFAAENAFEVPNTELLTIGTDHKVTLAYTPVEHSVFVRGMEEGSGTTPAAWHQGRPSGPLLLLLRPLILRWT